MNIEDEEYYTTEYPDYIAEYARDWYSDKLGYYYNGNINEDIIERYWDEYTNIVR
jgi:hypothetical protein